MSAKKLTLQVGKRGLKTLASDAIKDDFMRGLIELVTNADDSYSRLEMKKQATVGKIEISLLRRTRTGPTVLVVSDLAEGMDAAAMEQSVGLYGEDTSGESGRGIFGMGLKDTVNAFGDGAIVSIKDGKLYRCVLRNLNDLTIEESKVVTAADRRIYKIPANGTRVEVTITNSKIRIPQMDNLRRQIQTHVCLRPILTDPKRTVVLKELNSASEIILRYEEPAGEILVEKDLDLEGYPHKKAHLVIKKANGEEALSQQGSYRTGGVLIVSRRSAHQATLFGFDEEHYAGKLFGSLRCDSLYELQNQGELVVRRNRDGLDLDHPFSRVLWKSAKHEIALVIQKQKEQAEKERRAIENEETRKRFQEAVKDLNKIANQELEEIGGLGSGGGTRPIVSRPPLNGFEFIPDNYRVLVAERQKLKLKVQVDEVIKPGDLMQIGTDLEGIAVITPNVLVPSFKDPVAPQTVEIEVEGIQHGASGFVTATCKTKTAKAHIEVISEKRTRESHPRGGLFKDIKYCQEADNPQRARFERSSGIIFINTVAPSVALYLEPDGTRQGEAQVCVLVAELVTELACQEIAREKSATKMLDVPPGVERVDALINEFTRLKDQCGAIIHKALVNPKFRRK